MRVSFGFFRAIAEKKQYLQSGFRPENREIFRKPQFFLMRIKNPQIFDAERQRKLALCLAGGDGYGCDDVFHGAAAGQVIAGSCDALEDGAVGFGVADAQVDGATGATTRSALEEKVSFVK